MYVDEVRDKGNDFTEQISEDVKGGVEKGTKLKANKREAEIKKETRLRQRLCLFSERQGETENDRDREREM